MASSPQLLSTSKLQPPVTSFLDATMAFEGTTTHKQTAPAGAGAGAGAGDVDVDNNTHELFHQTSMLEATSSDIAVFSDLLTEPSMSQVDAAEAVKALAIKSEGAMPPPEPQFQRITSTNSTKSSSALSTDKSGGMSKKPPNRRDMEKRREQNRLAARRYRERQKMAVAAALSSMTPAHVSDPTLYAKWEHSSMMQPHHHHNHQLLSGGRHSTPAAGLLMDGGRHVSFAPRNDDILDCILDDADANTAPPAYQRSKTTPLPSPFPLQQGEQGDPAGASVATPSASSPTDTVEHANGRRGRLSHEQYATIDRMLNNVALVIEARNTPQNITGVTPDQVDALATHTSQLLLEERRKIMLKDELELIEARQRGEVSPVLQYTRQLDARQVNAEQAAMKLIPANVTSPLGWVENLSAILELQPNGAQRDQLVMIERAAAAALMATFASQPDFLASVAAVDGMASVSGWGADNGGLVGAFRNAANFFTRSRQGALAASAAASAAASDVESVRNNLVNASLMFLKFAKETVTSHGISAIMGGGGEYHAALLASGANPASAEGRIAPQADAMQAMSRAMQAWLQKLTPIQRARFIVLMRCENPNTANLPGPLLTLLSPFFSQSLLLILIGENPATHCGCWQPPPSIVQDYYALHNPTHTI